MHYAILLQRHPDGSYQASVPLLPGLIRTAATRDEVLQQVRNDLIEAMTRTEVIYLDVAQQPEGTPNPWLETAGMLRDDPTLEPMLAAIYAERDVE
jgi:predicted RNase H-like HicB family nuclease